jgi:Zn ribbon nucleic-acid-binding protein
MLPKPKEMHPATKYQTCPECGSQWNEYEQRDQECFTCGFKSEPPESAPQEPGAAPNSRKQPTDGAWPLDKGRGLTTSSFKQFNNT